MLRTQSAARHSRAGGYVVIIKTQHSRVFVIPAQAGIQCCFEAFSSWMPDQVRHDRQKIKPFFNSSTVRIAGVYETPNYLLNYLCALASLREIFSRVVTPGIYRKADSNLRATARKFSAQSSANGSAIMTWAPISPAINFALLAENWGWTKTA